jgi:hypothetical protein
MPANSGFAPSAFNFMARLVVVIITINDLPTTLRWYVSMMLSMTSATPYNTIFNRILPWLPACNILRMVHLKNSVLNTLTAFLTRIASKL